MIDAPWQILVVDDEQQVCGQITRQLEDESLDDTSRAIQVFATSDFASAYDHLETRKFDAVVLDVRDKNGEDAGVRTLNEIRARRFVPVVFYTGLPNLVDHLKSDVVRVVEKTEGLEAIQQALIEIVATGVPTANRAILRHVEQVQRDFMWDSHSILTSYQGEADKLSIAFMMARRLAASLAHTGIETLAKEMGDTEDIKMDGDRIHPMFYYIIPPMNDAIDTGGLYSESIADTGGKISTKHWVVLTNSCDLVEREKLDKSVTPHVLKKHPRKADRIILARCYNMKDQPEYLAWQKKPADDSVRELIKNNRKTLQSDRFHFLPAAIDFPDLVVDFQDIRSVTSEELSAMQCKAIIDSPFVESLVSRFTRYFSRLGTPDLDVEIVLARVSRQSQQFG